MWTTVVEWSVAALYLYVGIGAAFAAWFVSARVGRLDADAEHGSWGFRLAIAPGVAALWPWLLRRAFAGATRPAPRESSPHRDAARSER